MKLFYTLPLVLFLLAVTSSFSIIPKLKIQRKSRSSLHAFTILLASIMVPEKSRVSRDNGTKYVAKKAVANKKWGVDDTHEAEYWFDARIHSLGNVGFTGAVHAASAALVTKMIDVKAYNGVDIRQQVSRSTLYSR
jgi:hypothetical protein